MLAAALGMDDVAPEDAIPAEVIDLARAGKQIPAIRLLRKQRGLGLLAAKRVIDEIERRSGV